MSGEVIHATGDLFAKVNGVASTGGVAMNAPPADTIQEISDMVTTAMAGLSPSEHGQLVGIATKDADGNVNVNLALAIRANNHVEIVAWMGKSWGEPVKAGVIGKVSF